MKKRLLLIYNKIWNYRLEIFNEISKQYDLTIVHSDPNESRTFDNFNIKYVPVSNIGPLKLHKINLIKFSRHFDCVVGLYGPQWILILATVLNPFRKYSFSVWGIGVSASYEKKFDEYTRWDWLRYFLAKKSDSVILYSDYPIKKHVKYGINEEKIFVAHNTVATLEFDYNQIEFKQKDGLLFVGTLYKEKGVDKLLKVYIELLKKLRKDKVPKLRIVGDGPELDNLKQFCYKNKLGNKVKFYGAIYDEEKLFELYKLSFASISPNQAGLSVLSSMAYGVPFITSINSYTGGEIFNIENKENGILYKNDEEGLKNTLIYLLNNKDILEKMGRKAREHYLENRMPSQMANKIIEAVNYAYSKHSEFK